jgi:predicted lipoprotein with Yx(FWY)xxD motif
VSKFRSITIPLLLASALVAGCGSSYSSNSSSSSGKTSGQPSTSGGGSSAAVKTASVPSVGTVLVNSAGFTLYHLSAETNGKFICTGSCEGVWHPLIANGTPSGVESLGTIKRPDGSEQVTYKGTPLYTFAQDTKPGEAKGQGFKDVGTWSAVKVGSSAASTPATTSTGAEPSSSGGGYHY